MEQISGCGARKANGLQTQQILLDLVTYTRYRILQRGKCELEPL